MYEAKQPEWKALSSSAQMCKLTRHYICLYLTAAFGFAWIWRSFHDIGLSTLLTFSVIIQVVALAAMLIGIIGRKSVTGISLRSMLMQALSFGLRLCSTCWLKGYIPVDSTGDWLYQLADFSAFILCVNICYCIMFQYQSSYQSDQDTFSAHYVCILCIILAILVHPDLNNRPIFDSTWTSSLYIDVVSTLPQLWMIGKMGGKVEAISAHYVALVAVARIVDMIFWYYGFEELAPENGAFNLAGWTVLGAHFVHLILMWDFIYCYVKAISQGKLMDMRFDFGELIDV